jgi:hypothetical protein
MLNAQASKLGIRNRLHQFLILCVTLKCLVRCVSIIKTNTEPPPTFADVGSLDRSVSEQNPGAHCVTYSEKCQPMDRDASIGGAFRYPCDLLDRCCSRDSGQVETCGRRNEFEVVSEIPRNSVCNHFMTFPVDSADPADMACKAPT